MVLSPWLAKEAFLIPQEEQTTKEGIRVTMYMIPQWQGLLTWPPVVTNLLPLAALGVIWFVVVRNLRGWQRRAGQRNAPLRAGIFSRLNRYTEEDRREYWLKMKTMGRRQFVWRHGLLRWGLPVFAIFTPLMFFISPGSHPWSKPAIIGFILFSFVVWTIGGYCVGRITWSVMEKRYDE